MLSKIENDIPHYLNVDSTKRNRNEPQKTLVKFIEENGYYFDINSTEFFLAQANILTIYKRSGINNDPEISYDKLCDDLEVSKNTARKLVHIYQTALSEASCEFIQNIFLEDTTEILEYDFINYFKRIDEDERSVLPCYLVTKIILRHIKLNEKPILLVVKREYKGNIIDCVLLAFIPSVHNDYIFDSNFQKISSCDECYVLQGITSYHDNEIEKKQIFIDRILNVGLENIILFNMAAHPQYSGKKLWYLRDNPFSLSNVKLENENFVTFENEFLVKKTQSNFFGCNSINSSLFYIEHVFCDTLSRQKKLIDINVNHHEKPLLFRD